MKRRLWSHLCQAMVGTSVSHIVGKSQCSRIPIKNGFCYQHQPERKAAIDAARQEAHRISQSNLANALALHRTEQSLIRAALRLRYSINKRGFANTAGTITGSAFLSACSKYLRIKGAK